MRQTRFQKANSEWKGLLGRISILSKCAEVQVGDAGEEDGGQVVLRKQASLTIQSH